MFIYALVDPLSQAVRYVGYSQNPIARFRGHPTDLCTPGKREWFRALDKKNLEPRLLILESVTLENRSEREGFWINAYRQMGADLFNVASGGVPPTCGPITLAKSQPVNPDTYQALADLAAIRRHHCRMRNKARRRNDRALEALRKKAAKAAG